jgi:thymidine kinase
MATLYTELPKFTGELDLAKKLINFNDQSLHLWFSLDFIPGVKDIDIILWHTQCGAFVIEVKAIPISMLEEFGFQKCLISNRGEVKSPQYQAYQASIDLKHYIQSKIKKPPFFATTVCWPLISRHEWNNHWQKDEIKGEFSDRMIFKEDLNTFDLFKDRLKYIYEHPPIRGAAKNPYKHDPVLFDDFKNYFNSILSPDKRIRIDSDYKKLRQLENSIRSEALKRVPVTQTKKVIFTGIAGSGKTFRLLEIGYGHVIGGKNVLFICFNKVLATDIRRLLSYSEHIKASKSVFDVRDCFELLTHYAGSLGLKIDEIEYDVWAKEIVKELNLKQNSLFKYDTILIDEAQDLKNWTFDFIELLSHSKTSTCLSVGANQELYAESSSWLKDFMNNCQKYSLKRNFRNTRPVFQMAQLFLECKLDPKKIPKVMTKFKTTTTNTQQLICDRPNGQPPQLECIDESHLDYSNAQSIYFYEERKFFVVNEYKRIIQEQMVILRSMSDERPFDLLILIDKRQNNLRYECLISALNSLKIDYLDYTQEDNRRIIALPELVRICTFHSSRGIEGKRTLIFGLEKIESLAQEIAQENPSIDFTKLGYITLSRSTFECVIVFNSLKRNNFTDFLEKSINAITTFQDN